MKDTIKRLVSIKKSKIMILGVFDYSEESFFLRLVVFGYLLKSNKSLELASSFSKGIPNVIFYHLNKLWYQILITPQSSIYPTICFFKFLFRPIMMSWTLGRKMRREEYTNMNISRKKRAFSHQKNHFFQFLKTFCLSKTVDIIFKKC